MEFIYFTDSGGGMERSDFFPYLIMKAKELINNGDKKEDAINKVCLIFYENISPDMINELKAIL